MSESRSTALSGGAVVMAELLAGLEAALREAGVQHAHTEARDIVAAVAGEGRFWPTLNRDANVDAEIVIRSRAAARLRARGAPFAYCVGRAAFRHLNLFVDERVLIPRQETEQLVELVLRRTKGATGGIAADVGTGSGAIALALASEGNFSRVIGTDISQGALQVARKNAESLAPAWGEGCGVEFECCDMLSAVRASGLRVVVSNPPYIAFDEVRTLPASVRNWEPPEALYSPRNGLAATERLVRKSADLLDAGGLLGLEVDARRASLVAELVLANGRFHDVSVEPDLAGRERFVFAIKES